jgi:hypothetical protein
VRLGLGLQDLVALTALLRLCDDNERAILARALVPVDHMYREREREREKERERERERERTNITSSTQ